MAQAPTLRPYQVAAVEGLRACVAAGRRRVLLVSPTGSGKTVIMGEVIRRAQERQARVLFLAHRKELIDQTSAKLDAIQVDHGVIQANHDRVAPWLPVQVASIPTLARRTERPPASLIIVDEAHHARAGTYQAILDAYPNAPVLGATATPWRTDGRGLGELFEDVVVAARPKELIEQGHLVRYDGFAYDHPDAGAVPRRGRDYDPAGLELVMGARKVVGNIVEQWLAHARGRRTVVFAVNVTHSRALAQRFVDAGVAAEHLDGEMPGPQRDAILRRLALGATHVVCNVGVLTEGWDCLDSETEILTSQGWMRREQLAAVQRDHVYVYSLNRETERIEAVPIDDFGERLVRPGERMFSIESQHTNVRTTEGHQFHVKYRDGGVLSRGFLTKTGAELAARRSAYGLPLAAEMSREQRFPGVPLTDDELRLVAWFMTDGGFTRGRTSIEINQSKKYRHEIRRLLRRLKLDFKERTRPPRKGSFKESAPLTEFRIPKGTGRGSLARRGWIRLAKYLDKSVASALHRMTRRQFLVFWKELLKGDGEQIDKSGWLWCNRKEQVDAFMRMAVLRGLATSCSTRVTASGATVYRVAVRDRRWLVSDPADARAARMALAPPEPGEVVWCVRNRNSTLVTRRRGRVVIVGNCPSVEVVVLARPTLSAALYLQMVGRGMRPSPATGKTVCRIHDHAGCFLQHGAPDVDRDYSLDGDERRTSSGDAPPPLRTCKSCLRIYDPALSSSCPGCGRVNAPSAREIKELDDAAVRAIPLHELPQFRDADDDQKKKALEQLQAKAADKGYAAKWADVQFKIRFGHWPPRGAA